MNRIFNDSKDKNVATNIIYASASDAYAYADTGSAPAKIDAATLADLFHKGVEIVLSGVNYKPVSMSTPYVSGTSGPKYTCLTYVKADTTTATTAVLALINSKEYVSPTVGDDD